jgi:uncharacterized protein (DUF1810 family)
VISALRQSLQTAARRSRAAQEVRMQGSGTLERFTRAQDDPSDGFGAALEEIRSGGKRGHWIWYVFPQLAGLGGSAMSRTYAIRDAAEAEAYLRHPVLGPRLVAMASAVAEQLRRGVPLETVMGSSIDVLKLVSSLTLFGHVARQQPGPGGPEAASALVPLADEILETAHAAGIPACAFTLDRLTRRS